MRLLPLSLLFLRYSRALLVELIDGLLYVVKVVCWLPSTILAGAQVRKSFKKRTPVQDSRPGPPINGWTVTNPANQTPILSALTSKRSDKAAIMTT